MTTTRLPKYIYTVQNISINNRKKGAFSYFTSRQEVRQYTQLLKAQGQQYALTRHAVGDSTPCSI